MKQFSIQSFLNLSVFMLLITGALVVQSCATAKLPSSVTSAISSLGTELPRLMGQANLDYNPTFGKQAQDLLNQIKSTADAAGSKKKLAESLNKLASEQVSPFINKWKTQGKLDATTISNGIRDVNKAMTDIRKQAKMK
jgi:gas vesicle protein